MRIDEYESIPIEDVLIQLKANPKKGLNDTEVKERLEQCGHNVLHRKKESWHKKLLPFLWGPIPWIIEIAALLSFLLERWPDLFVIIIMLIFNAIIGFIQKLQAEKEIAILKNNLALHSHVLRNGQWQTVESKYLVPGDIIAIKLGNVIPADIKLIEGEYLTVDESELTHETLPVTKKPGDIVFSHSVIKMGEMIGVVTQTADKTYFGKTSSTAEVSSGVSRFEKAFIGMGNTLIAATLLISIFILLVSFYRLEVEHISNESVGRIIIYFLVLVVAGVPFASPAFFSVAMALGAKKLASLKAIVSRLSAVEELAAMDILCCNKTGSLTENRPAVSKITMIEGHDDPEILLAAALTCHREQNDTIDQSILQKIDPQILEPYSIEKMIPFDPIRKRAEAWVHTNDGSSFGVMKGAPQVILHLCNCDEPLKEKINFEIEVLAKKGLRTIGVAKTDSEKKWHYLGLIALNDPPRPDIQKTLEQIRAMGIEIKTITGDHESPSRELSHSLGLGGDIISVDKLYHENISDVLREELIVKSNGFAEVYPEHKFEIVKTLQKNHHIVGMTGDDVTDSPALKQADIGIAVSNSTDAARQAADVILTEEGLNVVCRAIAEARKTFGRMKSFMLYQMAETFRLLLFLFLGMFIFQQHPLTALMVILVALLNDIPIMMIAYDHMRIHSHPLDWNLKELLTISIGFATISTVSTFGLFWIGKKIWFANMTDLHLQFSYIQTLSFLSILGGGILTIFLTRNIGFIWQKPFPEWKFFLSVMISLVIGTLISVYGLNSPDLIGIGWYYVGLAWAYIFAWFIMTMLLKNFLYKILGYRENYLEHFVHLVEEPLYKE